MKMGLQTTRVFGGLIAIGLLTGTYFLGVKPLMNQTEANKSEISSLRSLNDSQGARLLQFEQGGVTGAEEAKAAMERFNLSVPSDANIESAARAIASALPGGVVLDGFEFGAQMPAGGIETIDQGLDAFVSPSEFSAQDPSTINTATGGSSDETQNAVAEASDEGGPVDNSDTAGVSAPVTGFVQVPFTITVSANSYNELAEYLNNLSDQSRLISVASINTDRSDTVSATLYAFAYING